VTLCFLRHSNKDQIKHVKFHIIENIIIIKKKTLVEEKQKYNLLGLIFVLVFKLQYDFLLLSLFETLLLLDFYTLKKKYKM